MILPDEDVIDSFAGDYRFLSNFYIEPDGTCVEVEYQRAKACSVTDRALFDNAAPGQAKRLGHMIPLRNDWNEVRLALMCELVRAKFLDHPGLFRMLLCTGTTPLVESNTWGDRFWGVCKGEGKNHLGRILMRVRRELVL